MSSKLRLHPSAGYIAHELESGALEVLLPAIGFRTEATGLVADELRMLFDGAPISERLQSLAKALPWLQRLTESSIAAEPLTSSNAIGAGNFGLLFIEVTGNCNERCLHCYAEAGPTVKSSLTRSTLMSVIEDAVTLGFSSVQFTGGDPFLHPNLLEAVSLATAHKLQVEIYTNGLLLTDKRVANLTADSPSIAFSLYSHIPDVHDKVTRTPGSLKRTLLAIGRSVKAGFPTRVGMVAMEANAPHLRQTIELLQGMGVAAINVTPSFEVGRGSQYLGSLPGDVQVSHNAGQQGVPKGKLCITYEGEVVPCIFNRSQVLGHLGPETSLMDIVRNPQLAGSGRTMDEVLTRCAAKLQCGSCRTTATALELLGAEHAG